MHTHETWQVLVRSAAQRACELAAYLVNTPDNPRGGSGVFAAPRHAPDGFPKLMMPGGAGSASSRP
jgi:hypothetical protein